MSADRREAVRRLHRARPRNRFVRRSAAFLGILVGTSWLLGDFRPGRWLTPERGEHLRRYVGELLPWPVQRGEGDPLAVAQWFLALWRDGAGEAFAATLATSLAAILLAGLGAAVCVLPASRTLATPRPYLPDARPPGRRARAAWSVATAGARGLLMFLRAIPEYVWAFLLLGMLGPTAWPLVLALALHNAGILGRLGAEVVETSDDAAPAALRGLGAGRLQIALAAVLPRALGRWLLYLFYRWETCVREATVLGMLGMASLGYGIVESRAHNRYDEMMVYVLLAAVLVLAGDVVSTAARGLVRRA